MVVALAQIKPHIGDIEKNITRHVDFIKVATDHRAHLIIFPELSLTGYEPKLANALAMNLADSRLEIFQAMSDLHHVTIGLGVPLRVQNGVTISLVLFSPAQPRVRYSKHFLHADEVPHFVPGDNIALTVKNKKVALAICYELSVDTHRALAFKDNPDLYISSVAKTRRGTTAACEVLSRTAKNYETITMMCNSIGIQDGEECTGTTSAWNSWGDLIGQLDERHEGLLFIDSDKGVATDFYFEK